VSRELRGHSRDRAGLLGFRGGNRKNELSGRFIATDDIRLASRAFHFTQGLELVTVLLQSRLQRAPVDSRMTTHVAREPILQGLDQFVTNCRFHLIIFLV
jgi:hypothetical protein